WPPGRRGPGRPAPGGRAGTRGGTPGGPRRPAGEEAPAPSATPETVPVPPVASTSQVEREVEAAPAEEEPAPEELVELDGEEAVAPEPKRAERSIARADPMAAYMAEWQH